MAVPVRRRVTHTRPTYVPQEVDVVETAIFRLNLSLLDTFTASAAILPLVRHHGSIVHYTSHSQRHCAD